MGFLKIVSSLLSNPGDHAEARVTENNRRVATFSTADGSFKASKTEYPNGTVHETRTYRA